jgi:predicted acylesterase/phospholipase RssA
MVSNVFKKPEGGDTQKGSSSAKMDVEPHPITRKILSVIFNLVIIPMLWLTRIFTNYTLSRQRLREEQRYGDILSSTEDFETWKATAAKLDEIREFNTWRLETTAGKYVNSEALFQESKLASDLYNSRDFPTIEYYLRTQLSRDANGLTHPLLFRYYTGTKLCVEEYINVVSSLIKLYSRWGLKADDQVPTPTIEIVNNNQNLEINCDGLDDEFPALGEPTPPLVKGQDSQTVINSSVFATKVRENLQKRRTTEVEENGCGGEASAPDGFPEVSPLSTDLAPCNSVCSSDSPTIHHRYAALLAVAKSFGRTALMLSGGASLGVYHSGVVRALVQADLLPQIITGSSAGAIISSIVCTRTDEEIRELMGSEMLGLNGVSLAAFEDTSDTSASIDKKVRRLFESGAFMDLDTLVDMLKYNCGDMTFKEAYEHTKGRILNISVGALREGEHQDRAVLLNYLTSPNVIIWSAVSASCAMPGLFTAVQLIEKGPNGQQRPFLKNQRFFDGSVARDIPKEGIATLFNVNYFIVSQTNPHVIPFYKAPPSPLVHKKGQGLLATLWFAWCKEWRHWLVKLYRFNLLPKKGAAAVPYLMATQSYEGNITIFPIGNVLHALPDFINITANPSVEHMAYVLAKAQRRTWPFLTQIYCVTEIERTLQEELRQLQSEIQIMDGKDII